MRELRSWIFLGLGLLLAGLTGLSLYGVSQDYGKTTAAATIDTTEIVVARSDIATRAVLTADMLAIKSYPKALAPAGALTNQADAVGQTTVASIPAGAAVVRSQLLSAKGRSGGSVTLDKGEGLLALPTVDPLALAGLVRPGARIALLPTVTPGHGR